MTNPATTSLLDRANLDRDAVRREVSRGLQGADDGELFLEFGQTEALVFDNGRLKQATYDTSQGFGLRAVKDDALYLTIFQRRVSNFDVWTVPPHPPPQSHLYRLKYGELFV